MRLKEKRKVEFVVRITESGNALASTGDWQVVSQPIDLVAQANGVVALHVSEQIP